MKMLLLLGAFFAVLLNPTDVLRNGVSLASEVPADVFAVLQPGTNEIKFDYEGRARRLLVTTPKDYDRQRTRAILFCFHGAGGKADRQSERWSPQADLHDLIVVSAEAVRPLAKWNFKDDFHAEEHDDVGFVKKVVGVFVADKIADPSRVYATGHSSGGLFCYRLAKETDLFAALSPMSCGMAKDAHDPSETTKPVSIMQVIGDQDKSFNGTSNPKVTMYSAAKRIDIWRKFNQCGAEPVLLRKGDKVVVSTYANPAGVEVAYCMVKGEGHHIREDLRDIADGLAVEFLLRHKRK